MLSLRTKGILTIIGSFCFHFMVGTVYVWSAINPYFTTYLKYNGNSEIKQVDVFFIMPIIVLLQYALLPIGIILGDKIGTKYITGIGSLLMLLSFVFIKVYPNFAFVMFSICLFGIGASIGFLYLIKNGWNYFPTKTGVISGIILGGLALSSVILNPLSDFIINQEKATPDVNGFYPEKIANSFNSFLTFIIILYIILGIISVSLTFTFMPEKVNEQEIKKQNKIVKGDVLKNDNMTNNNIPVIIIQNNSELHKENKSENKIKELNIIKQDNKIEVRLKTEESEKTLKNENIKFNIDVVVDPRKIIIPLEENSTNIETPTLDKRNIIKKDDNLSNNKGENMSKFSKYQNPMRKLNQENDEQQQQQHFGIVSINVQQQNHTFEDKSTQHTEQTKEVTTNLHNLFQPGVEDIVLALKSKQNVLLFCIVFIAPFFPILLTNTNRAFGNLNDLSQSGLQIMSLVSAILNFSTRFLWGFLIDKCKFKILMSIILFLQLAISISVYYSSAHLVSYVIANVVIGSCVAGIFTTFPPTFNKIFGVTNGAKIYSYSGVLIGISSLLGPVLTKGVIKVKNDYLIVYCTASGLILIAIIILFFIDEKSFDYTTHSSKTTKKKQNNTPD